MDDDKHKRPIIIKRIIKKHNKHHGGAWKIAYADFVTAMMSFFLLMWLLSLLNKYQLEGIAQYFRKPLKEVFTKQDMVAPIKDIRPDQMGKTADINHGSKEKNQYSGGNNQEIEQKSKKVGGSNQDKQMKAENAMKQIQDMKNQLESDLNKDPELSQYKNSLNFVVTSDGLKIQIKDLENKPMFSEGGIDFQKYATKVMNWLSKELNEYPNHLVILGHTDSQPYPADVDYGNWELSADRANATRRALVKAGMSEDKIMRVMGVSDKQLLDKQDSYDPANRRIEIIVLTDDAAKKMDEQ